jgi:hypothetical protein
MKMTRQFSAIVLGAALASTPALAWGQQSNPNEGQQAKHDARKAGQETKGAARDTGRAVKHGSKKAYHSTKRATRHAARKTKNTTRGAYNGAKQGAQQPH